jgi:hypothetical protein
MQAIILVLLSFVNEFFASETGFVRQRHGLPVAWAAGVLVAAAVVLGTPGSAAAGCGPTPCNVIGECAGMGGSSGCNWMCITQGHYCGQCEFGAGGYYEGCQCYH